MDTRYDSQGRKFKTTKPYFTDSAVDDKLWVASDTDIPSQEVTKYDGAGRTVEVTYRTLPGGRVLTVVGRGRSHREAIETAYRAASQIRFEGMQLRRDIGKKALAALDRAIDESGGIGFMFLPLEEEIVFDEYFRCYCLDAQDVRGNRDKRSEDCSRRRVARERRVDWIESRHERSRPTSSVRLPTRTCPSFT